MYGDELSVANKLFDAKRKQSKTLTGPRRTETDKDEQRHLKDYTFTCLYGTQQQPQCFKITSQGPRHPMQCSRLPKGISLNEKN